MDNQTVRRTSLLSLTCIALSVSLSACSGDELSRQMGIVRDVPDEFQVTTRAPLSMPPDYKLRPPSPGAPRPQELSAPQSAEAALVPQTAISAGDSVGAGATSAGQQALLTQLGVPAPANIRQTLQHDAAIDSPGSGLTDQLMFWRKTQPPGVVVDPQKEAQRLRENAALGRNVETGDTPIIQRTQSSGGLLNGLF